MRSLTLGQGHLATGEGSGPTVVDSLVIDGSDEESRDDGRKQCSLRIMCQPDLGR